MAKLAIVVDENVAWTIAVQSALIFQGYEVRCYHTATDAYDFFTSSRAPENNKEFKVAIDIAMSGGSNDRLFGHDVTSAYTKTGIILAQHLVQERPEYFNVHNTVLYTCFYLKLWPDVVNCSENLRIGRWKKDGQNAIDGLLKEFAKREEGNDAK